MPYRLQYDSLGGILHGRFEGAVTDEDLMDYCRDSTARIEATKPRAAVTDLSEVTSFEVSRQTIIELAGVRPAIPEQDPVRVIIASSAHVFGMARMFELEGRNAHPNVHVVRSRQEACAILGVTDLQFADCEK